ncbi:MAG TPA: hypothetical protein VMG62_04265, partial [Solirubrobacteraceae bacterium]|nr:hypothetical protein [Solirubrobacteraceae bacterium]
MPQLLLPQRSHRVRAHLGLGEALHAAPRHRRHRRQRGQRGQPIPEIRHEAAQIARLTPRVKRVVVAAVLAAAPPCLRPGEGVAKAPEQRQPVPQGLLGGLLGEGVQVVVHRLRRHHPSCGRRPPGAGHERGERRRHLSVQALLAQLAQRQLAQARVADRARPLLIALQLRVRRRPH